MNQYLEGKKPKVFIAGDSWGCGEWSDSIINKTINHEGLCQYLTDAGYTVINSSHGGYSNSDSIRRLLTDISQYYEPQDLILWIQTDSFRDIDPSYTNFSQHIINENGIDQLVKKLLRASYQELDNIGKNLNTQIHLIGGMQDIDLQESAEFTNLNVLVTSWTRLLVGHMLEFDTYFPQHTSGYNLARLLDKKLFNNELFFKTIDVLYQIEKNWRMFTEKIFHPDGSHPNRDGHKMLFEFIVNELKL